MPKVKTKYTIRKDGSLEYAPTYKGHRKHFYRKTDREIEKKVEEWKAEIDGGTYLVPTYKKVADDYWEKKEKDLSVNTVHGYDIALRRSIEEFGDLPVNKITPQMIYQFLDSFKAKGYSSKVISNTKPVMRGVFDLAFIQKNVDFNPCASIPIIKGKPKVARQPASDGDLEIIEEIKNDSSTAKMYYFMLYTGARRGEASAMQMKDIDLNAKTASVNKTLAFDQHGHPVLKDCPKTEAGKRTLELTDNLIGVIPIYDNPETYIFYPDGFPNLRKQQREINKFREKNGINATHHQLRHSYASISKAPYYQSKESVQPVSTSVGQPI